MKLKRRKKESIDGSSASSDIAFLLIIYFIVIAGFNVNIGFLVNLPAKDSTRLILREDLLRFEMCDKGNVFYEEEIVSTDTIREIVSVSVAHNPNIAVIITIDKEAPWQNVVSFVELAQDLRIDSFSFSMKKENI
jgi:biopolymer transport protein ExbD